MMIGKTQWNNGSSVVMLNHCASSLLAAMLGGFDKETPWHVRCLEVRCSATEANVRDAAHFAFLNRMRAGGIECQEGIERDRATAQAQMKDGNLLAFALFNEDRGIVFVHMAHAVKCGTSGWEELAAALAHLKQLSGVREIQVFNPACYLEEPLWHQGFETSSSYPRLFVKK